MSIRVSHPFALTAVMLVALGWPCSLRAQQDLDIVDDGGALSGATTYQVMFENDALANTDRGYTNGLQLSRIRSPRERLPGWARPILRGFQLCVEDNSWSPRRRGL